MIPMLGTHRRVDAALPVAPALELSGVDLLGYADGDQITSWPDGSGNGHDLAQTQFGVARYHNSDAHGPGAEMDTDGFGDVRIAALESATITVCAVLYPGYNSGGAITPGGSVFSIKSGAYTGIDLRCTTSGALQLYGYDGAWKPNPGATLAHTAPIVVSAWWEINSQGIRVNGSSEWSDTRTYGLAGYDVSTRVLAGGGFKGKLWHLVYYTSRLSLAEIIDTEAYLLNLWSIP